jgi:hypothetical protein
LDCISKKAVLDELETKQDVETYLNGFEAEINYFKCLKLLKLMEFKAKKERKISTFYSHSQIKKAKLGQSS